ncbi:MAG: hypothetical protein J5879_08370 [Clostridia bacterium]|nr:hypothetical protein [Clostridia bacterium]
MKKFLSIIVAAILVASLIPAVVSAEEEVEYVRPGNDGNVIVPYISGDGITIDGTLTAGEWSETNKLILTKASLRPWAGFPEYRGQIDYYYSWGDKGLYMAAVVLDDTLEDGIGAGNLATRFQIALNPAGIISDMYGGLFFSLTPEEDTDIVHMYRHNWESSADGNYDATEDEGYEGKYTLIKEGEEIIGWNLECVIPWNMISSEDRYTDLDDTDEIYLTNFNPKDENRARAFCTATICYVQCNTSDGSGLETLGRTCTDGDGNNFNTDSYDIILLFALPGETDRSTETEYFTPENAQHPETSETQPAETEPAETKEDTEPATTTEPTPVATESEDAAPATSEEGSKAPETQPEGGKASKAAWIIALLAALPFIGIALGVIIVVVIIIVIVKAVKKKKNNK